MVAMNYTVLVEGVILLFLAVVYFFHKSKYVHIGCGLGILLMAYVMHFPTIALLVIGISVFAISYFFLTTRNKARMFSFIILLFLLPTLVLAADKNDTIKIDVEKVKYVDEVAKVTQQPSLSLTGTDYLPGDEGKLQAYLKVGEFPLSTAACYIDVLYPDMTFFLSDYIMLSAAHLHHFEGLYYLDFVVPNVTGVYPVNAYCYYNATPGQDYVSGIGAGVNSSVYPISQTGNYSFDKVFWYPFDEVSGVVANDVLSDVDGEYMNSPDLTIIGNRNTGVKFDGINDYVRVPSASFSLNSTQRIAVCFGINAGTNLPNGAPILWLESGTEGYHIEGADDELLFSSDRSATGRKNFVTNAQFDDSSWHTVCFYNGLNVMESYVDGVLDKTSPNAQLGSVTSLPTYLRFGTTNTESAFSDDALDEMCIIIDEDIDIATVAADYELTKSCSFFTPTPDDDTSLLNIVDGKYFILYGASGCDNKNCSYFFNLTLPLGWYTLLLEDANIIWEGYKEGGDTFNFYVHNYDTDERLFWFTLSGGGVTNQQFHLGSSFANSTVIGVEVEAFDWDDTYLYNDFLSIIRLYNGSYVGDLRGNDELVVSKGIQNISDAVNSDIEFVNADTSILIILLVIVLFLLFIRQEAFSGLFLGLWTLLYSPNIYITILFLLLSVVMIWWGISRRQQ